MRKVILVLMLLYCLLVIGCSSNKTDAKIQNGDIIFQKSKSRQSIALEKATRSMYTHCGIIYESQGKYYVYEAVQPVKLTPLSVWISRGVEQKYVIKRLKHADKLLTPRVLQDMREYGEGFRGKNYDTHFNWDDSRLYCSELVWKIYKNGANVEVGKLRKLKDFDLEYPLVKQIMKERYGADIPLDETVISPQDIFESPKLYEVKRG
jgi:uncharacterized protein YycO